MKTILFTLLAATMLAAQAQIKHIKPGQVYPMPPAPKTQVELDRLVEDDPIYSDLYGGRCSWYCGGVVDTVMASSQLHRIKRFTYEAAHAHDFDHESVWAEGATGQGIGEWLLYKFPGSCPRITTVKILNGHVKNPEVWRNNSRVKQLLMYYNDTPLAILDLDDSRSLQCFDVGVLGPHDAAAPQWSLKFEILDVYPGAKHDDTVIAELFFDGIDVH